MSVALESDALQWPISITTPIVPRPRARTLAICVSC